jgi:polysaccharide biosynthesis protein VpsQ
VSSSNRAEGRQPGPPQRSGRRQRWVPFLILLTIVASAVIAANLSLGGPLFEWIEQHPGSDKFCHFALLGGLAMALNSALHGRLARLGPVSVQLGGLLVAIVITAEEFSQRWIPSRSFDWGDLAANYAGIACADWLARRWLR